MTFWDCADSITPLYWLGRPGDLVNVKVPNEGYDRTPNAHVAVHDLLAGTAVDRSFYEQRTWTIAYDFSNYNTWSLIEQFRTRQRGIGPFVWIDPHTVNCLTSNQSSGTDAWLSTSGFIVTGSGEVLASSASVTPVRGTRALQWSVPITVTGSGGGVMSLTNIYGPSGWATPPSQGWTFNGQLQGGGVDPAVNVTPRLLFLDANGTVISSASGVTITSAAGSWSSWIVTGTAPVNAVWTLPQLIVTPASVTGNAILYFDDMMLDMRIDPRGPRAWQPGQGQPWVAILSNAEAVSRIGRTNAAFKLIELSASF